MKFRAVISDYTHVKEFCNLISTLSRMQKNLIINIQPSKVMLQIEAEACDGQFLWCDIDATNREGFFSQYDMDGVDAGHNQIYMVTVGTSFVRALSYVRNNCVEYVKLKLIRTSLMPCLSVEMAGTISNQSEADAISSKMQHSLPITIVPRNEWDQYELPLEMPYDLSIAMPSIRSLRALLDKKKTLAPTVTLYTTMNDEMSLIVETDLVTVASHYRHLKCVPAVQRSTGDEQFTHLSEACCRVDSKKLAAIFEIISMSDVVVTANVRHELALNICFDMHQMCSLNYILPATNFD
ncbi:mitotic and DNA damage checkpoint protein hus1 [Anopheles darlingi]|uniref:Checkpoint protein n=1 Tax=Anopheles darlingi TaxID=43151 RepID=W5JX24_ANODA|nr:mitotic and DNA damage checkpoint protein hus1 [Anopheles darlingi]